MDVLDLIASDNYITLNKTLLKKLGIEATILFGALCSFQRYFNGEEFYKEQDKLMEETCLSEYLLRNATKILKDLGLISVIKKGLPAKNYYKVNANKLIELLTTSDSKIDTTSDIKNDTTGSIKFDSTYNKNIINNKDNNKYIVVLKYLNEKTGANFRPIDTNLKLIKARMQDYTEQDLKNVIDKKVKEWKGTEMQQYLRPKTLFNATNFENYVNSLENLSTNKNNFIHNNYTSEQISGLISDLDNIEV